MGPREAMQIIPVRNGYRNLWSLGSQNVLLITNQMLSLSCLSRAIAFGKKSKPLTKSLLDLCFLPLPPYLIFPAPPISHSLQSRLPPLCSFMILKVFLFKNEFTFCSFCLKCFSLDFRNGWSFNFHIYSDSLPSLCIQTLSVPFLKQKLT